MDLIGSHLSSHRSNMQFRLLEMKLQTEQQKTNRDFELQKQKMYFEREWRIREQERQEKEREANLQRQEDERQWRIMQQAARDNDIQIELRRIELEEKRLQQQNELIMFMLQKFADK